MEYKIEKIVKGKGRNYMPAQILGGKRILRTSRTMTIKECKDFIKNHKHDNPNKSNSKWVLLEIS